MNKGEPKGDLRDRIAASRGQCGKCYGPIVAGEVFRWEGQPPQPKCARCLEKSKHARGANLGSMR